MNLPGLSGQIEDMFGVSVLRACQTFTLRLDVFRSVCKGFW